MKGREREKFVRTYGLVLATARNMRSEKVQGLCLLERDPLTKRQDKTRLLKFYRNLDKEYSLERRKAVIGAAQEAVHRTEK